MPSDTYTLIISDVGVSTPANGSVTTVKLADYDSLIAGTGVTTAKIVDSAITSAKIANGTIVEADIANGAITTDKISNLNVTTGKIADVNVTTAKIADLNVTTAKIADGAITTAKILDGTILSGDISLNTIALDRIATIAAGRILGNATGGTTTIAASPCTAFGFSMLAAANATGGRTVLGLGALATENSLTVSFGGTGQTSYNVGDILYASGATSLAKLTSAVAGNALIAGGALTAPLWGKIGLTTHVSGTLPVANGGTGVTASTGSGSNVFSSGPTLVAPVLGTPTSGTLTNCTGLPLAGVVGIVTGTFVWATNGTTQVSVPVTGMTNTSKVFIQQYGTTGAENHAYMTFTASGGFTVTAGASITAGKTYNYLAIL